jgi:serine/threonine protein kinase
MERLRLVLRQVSRALIALHESGHLHRDIKPSNVMVDEDGRAVVLDFGVVSALGSATSSGARPSLAGTPSYMAPEQADPERQPGPAADWYGLGVMLYEALTGQRPFWGSPGEVIEAKRRFEPVRPDELVRGLPEDLVELCVELLRREPAARPSGTDVLRRLGDSSAESQPEFHEDRDRAFLVGREPQLEMLQQAFRVLRRGQGGAVLVGGRSGMGKSLLVNQFMASLEGSGALLVQGRCYERESVPYKALYLVLGGGESLRA